MDYGEKTGKFLGIVIEEMKPLIVDLESESERNEIGKAFIYLISGKSSSYKPKKRLPHHHSFLINEVFSPLNEILTTIDALSNTVIYIRSFPSTYKRQGISKLTYLRYHFESFLNELYILKERLGAYTTRIERGYKKSQNSAIIKDLMSKLRISITKTFEETGAIRGRHVHKRRYSDLDFDSLSALELLSLQEKDKFGKVMKILFKLRYKEIRKKLYDSIMKNIEAINEIIEAFFEVLTTAITRHGRIVYPTNYRIA